MKKVPRAIIFSGYGLNCEEETKHAFELAEGAADIVHINDVIAKPSLLKAYQILAMPGGFSYGDHLGSGRAYALKLKNHLSEPIKKFLERDTLMIGICNGFQIVTNSDLLPGSLLPNTQARYIDRWVDLKVVGESPWLEGITELSLPIAHGEGRYYLEPAALEKLERKNFIGLQYINGEVCQFQHLEANPNGSVLDIAGVLGYEGRMLGLMPHPERATSFFQLPQWTTLRDEARRRGLPIGEEGPGLALFKNAIHYFV